MNIKQDFPALNQTENGHKLVYLDSAATTMRPDSVLRAMDDFYRSGSANPNRGLYGMAQRSTEAYASARKTVADFIGAKPEETIFTRNTSEALNIVAYCRALDNVREGDNIAVPISEHHSNIVPWQRIAKLRGAELRFMYLDRETGELPDAEIDKIDARTKLVAFAHISNVLGTVLPVEKITERAKKFGAVTVLDMAQSVPHMKVDVKALGVDFAAFSAHKMYGPMGIGALYGRYELLESMPPFLSGGDMIEEVAEQETTWAKPPNKFEAGTQNAAGAVGFAEAVRYIESAGRDEIEKREKTLLRRLIDGLRALPYVKITCDKGYDTAERRAVAAFSIDGVHPHDAATVLNEYGVAIRAGKHCAHPLLGYLDVPIPATSRASLGIYTDEDDIDAFLSYLPEVRRILGL